MVPCARLLHVAPPAEKLGSELSDDELWSEVPYVRLLQALPSEQVDRGSTEEREKVRLHYLDSLFISWELLMGFAVKRVYQPFSLGLPPRAEISIRVL